MRRPHRVVCRWAGRSTAWPGAQTLTRSGPLGFVTAVVDTVPAAGVACWCAGRCTLADDERQLRSDRRFRRGRSELVTETLQTQRVAWTWWREASGSVADLGVLVPLAVVLVVGNGLSATAVLLPAGLTYLLVARVYRVPVADRPLPTTRTTASGTSTPRSATEPEASRHHVHATRWVWRVSVTSSLLPRRNRLSDRSCRSSSASVQRPAHQHATPAAGTVSTTGVTKPNGPERVRVCAPGHAVLRPAHRQTTRCGLLIRPTNSGGLEFSDQLSALTPTRTRAAGSSG